MKSLTETGYKRGGGNRKEGRNKKGRSITASKKRVANVLKTHCDLAKNFRVRETRSRGVLYVAYCLQARIEAKNTKGHKKRRRHTKVADMNKGRLPSIQGSEGKNAKGWRDGLVKSDIKDNQVRLGKTAVGDENK